MEIGEVRLYEESMLYIFQCEFRGKENPEVLKKGENTEGEGKRVMMAEVTLYRVFW